ncbi:hypothetical protein Pfo_009623 [Paulownia fortunei]|nr:hypothetical protein Pfo_009623 [Paulownia fortunei]
MSLKFHLTIILKKILLIISNMKWAFDFLLHQSFFQSSCSCLDVLQTVDSHSVRRNSEVSADSNECAVCLCRIEDGVEIRELKCSHVFHCVCLDRWVGYGHWTCPLCRNHLKLPRVDAELHQEALVFNFCDVRSRNNDQWWLR